MISCNFLWYNSTVLGVNHPILFYFIYLFFHCDFSPINLIILITVQQIFRCIQHTVSKLLTKLSFFNLFQNLSYFATLFPFSLIYCELFLMHDNENKTTCTLCQVEKIKEIIERLIIKLQSPC